MMTHVRPGLGDQGAVRPLTHSLALRPTPIALDSCHILTAIEGKRAEIAFLEADRAVASERAAARSLGGIGRLGDRDTWDRATWNRYLAAASDSQDLYVPRLRRLYAEVDCLERLQSPLSGGHRRVA